MSDTDFLLMIVREIVAHPDDITIERTVDERGVLLLLKVHPMDMGYVVGKEGRTAQALRTLLNIVGAKANAKVSLKIYDPKQS